MIAAAGKVKYCPNCIVCLTCDLHIASLKQVKLTDNHDFMAWCNIRQVIQVTEEM